MKKSYFIIILIIIAVVFLGRAYKNTGQSSEKTPEKEIKAVSNSNLKFPGVLPDEKIKNKKAILKTSKGMIEFELYADKASKTVSNFVYLAENKFYDGLVFHRVVPGFVAQGGDPTGTGSGGPGYQFDDEAVQGEYKAGTVAMANAGPNTNGSQFFICLEDQSSLPKLYNLFGQVTSGMEVVGKIQIGDKIESVTIANR